MAIDPRFTQTTLFAEAQKARKTPPYPVVLVALCQFLKAGFLLFLLLKVCDLGGVFNSNDQTAIGQVMMYGIMAVLVGGALYFSNSGYRLLRLEKSARRQLMWNIVAGWLLFGTSMNGILFGQGPFISAWPNRILISVLVLDLFLYCCLAFYPNVAESFGDNNESDLLP